MKADEEWMRTFYESEIAAMRRQRREYRVGFIIVVGLVAGVCVGWLLVLNGVF